MAFRGERTGDNKASVRSALFKQCTGALVVTWVTTSEYPLLYAFLHFFLPLQVINASAFARTRL
jgi:hypothetical protein